MNPLWRGLVLRRLTRHRLRSTLAAVAVALGVAVFLASFLVGDTVARSARVVADATTAGVDLAVRSPAGGPPRAVASVVERVPGVRAAAPLRTTWCRVRGLDGARALVVGVDPVREMRLARGGGELTGIADAGAAVRDPLTFLAGRGALVPASFELQLGEARRLELLGRAGWDALSVAGTLPAGPLDRAGAGRTVVVTLDAVDRLAGRPGVCDRIDVAVESGADVERVRTSIEAALAAAGHGTLSVAAAGQGDDSASDLLGTVEVGLTIGAVVSLLVGVFLIHHTLAIGVAERRREVGILRALGATRAQVRGVFAVEALLIGGAGSVLGVLLAAVLARGAVSAFARAVASAYFDAETPAAELTPLMALCGIAAGLLASWLAAVIPAARAAAEEPADAVRRGPEVLRPLSPRARRIRVAIVGVVGGGALLLVAFPHVFGRFSGYGALSLGLVALLSTTPVVLAAGGHALAPLVARVFGVPGRLAADDLRRRPLRSALPAAALAFGLALVVETHGTISSMSAETTEWLESDIAGDLFVSSGASVLGMGRHAPFPHAIGARIEAVEGVLHVVGVRFVMLPYRGTRAFALGIDPVPFRAMTTATLRGVDGPGARDAALAALADGRHCIVSENFARLHGLGIGDTVDFPGRDGPLPLEIVALGRDYSWPRGTVFMDRHVFERELGDDSVDEFSVVVSDAADADLVIARIGRAVADDLDLVVTQAAELRAGAKQLLDDFFSLSYAQVAVAMTVAFLGVLNALWIAVILRRRELALLRAVGATRTQVVLSVLVQAGCLGLLGGVLGVAGGMAVEWVVVQRVMPAETGWVYAARWPWGAIALTFAASLVASLVAGIVPAGLAAATPLREALGDE